MAQPLKVLFICHGNICRSPLAEYLCRHIAAQRGVGELIATASAGTSAEEIGNPVYPPVAELLRQMGIDCADKRARQINPRDLFRYDLLVVMERFNLVQLRKAIPNANLNCVRRLLDFTSTPGDIDDPWYTRDFKQALEQIQSGCTALLDHYGLTALR